MISESMRPTLFQEGRGHIYHESGSHTTYIDLRIHLLVMTWKGGGPKADWIQLEQEKNFFSTQHGPFSKGKEAIPAPGKK